MEIRKMAEIIVIETLNKSYMLPIKLHIGFMKVYCERYEFDKEYLYCWVNNHIVFYCHLIDIEEFVFVRCV